MRKERENKRSPIWIRPGPSDQKVPMHGSCLAGFAPDWVSTVPAVVSVIGGAPGFAAPVRHHAVVAVVPTQSAR